MTREEALEEIEQMIEQAIMQTQGMMDWMHEASTRDLAEDVLSIAARVS